MQLIDTHAHIASSDFSSDLAEVLQRAEAANVKKIVCVASGDGFKSAYDSIALAALYDNIWATAGVHPLDATTEIDGEKLLSLANQNKVVAIGETGLDYYYEPDTKELQQAWLRLHIEIALQLNKPLIIHSRNAAADCFNILQEMHAEKVGGVFHCYAEDAAFAKELRKLNFLVSFTGILTFKKAIALQAAAKEIPLEQIMLETDSPYLAPIPYRGKRCEPAYVLKVAEFLANLKNISIEEVAERTTQTAQKFFNI